MGKERKLELDYMGKELQKRREENFRGNDDAQVRVLADQLHSCSNGNHDGCLSAAKAMGTPRYFPRRVPKDNSDLGDVLGRPSDTGQVYDRFKKAESFKRASRPM